MRIVELSNLDLGCPPLFAQITYHLDNPHAAHSGRYRSRSADRLRRDAGDTTVLLAAAWRVPGNRNLDQARKPHPGGRLQAAWRPGLLRSSGGRLRDQGCGQRDAWQPRSIGRAGRQAPRPGGAHRRALREQQRKERCDARARRRIGRARGGLPGGPRIRFASGQRARLAPAALLPSIIGGRGGHLCAGIVACGRGSGDGLCADRPGVGDLRDGGCTRCARSANRGGRGGVGARARLRAVVCRPAGSRSAGDDEACRRDGVPYAAA
jgi:hypothetical protein